MGEWLHEPLVQLFTHATKLIALEQCHIIAAYWVQLCTGDDYILHGACNGYVFKHLDPTL